MADQYKNIVRFYLIAPSSTISLPHNLNVAGRALIPDYVDPNPKGLLVTADDTNVTVTNTTSLAVNVDVLVEGWRSIERVFGSKSVLELSPRPFVSGGSDPRDLNSQEIFTGVNGDVVSLMAAMPIAQPTTTLVRAAAGYGFARANVIGLVIVGAAVTLPVKVLTNGILQLPIVSWDAVTGTIGGLVPGARYYLDVALGRLTTAPPIAFGKYITVIGSAITPDTLIVKPEPPILL